LASLNDALLGCLNMLRPDDWVCFNVGNSSKYLTCDMQKNMISWKDMPQKFEIENDDRKNTESRSLSMIEQSKTKSIVENFKHQAEQDLI
jgi:hypothetical protein